MGARINLDLVVDIKLSTQDKKGKTSKVVFTLVPPCSRGAIQDIIIDIHPPRIETSEPTQPASRSDIASQDLITALDQLTLQ